MKNIPITNPAVFKKMEQVDASLKVVLKVFVESETVKRDLGSNGVDRLRKLLDTNGNLMDFSALVRELMVDRGSNASFDTTAYWHVIDSISFRLDANEGRWSYMDDSDRLRYLSWSEEMALGVRVGLQSARLSAAAA